MSDPVWLTKAKTVPAGQSIRIECCSADRSMLVSNNRKGYTAWCFRCREPHFQPHGEFSLAVLARRRAELALINERTVALPKDFTLEIPTDEAVWLYKAGISSELARYYGIGWSEFFGRVIVPVYSNGELVAYTARLQHGKPKYIEKSINPGGCIFVASGAMVLPSYRAWAMADGPDLVFVEDNLSAIRVGRVAKRVVSLMGTSANAVQVAQSCNNHTGLRPDAMGVVVVWLDPDRPGRKASAHLCASLRLLGYTVHELASDRDPKFYSNREIKEYLSFDRHCTTALD